MTTLDALLDAVMTLISTPSVVPILQLNSNTKERAFEAYVFCLAVAAVRRATGEVEVHGATSGVNPSTIVFRGGPGNMGSTAQDFCYAKCTLGRKTFEIHVDVTYIGTSGAAYEIDVSLYDGVAADAVR